MTFEQIKELVELVAQRQLQGLELERSGFRLKIDGHAQQQVVVAAPSAPAMPAVQTLAAVPAAAPVAAPSAPPSAAAPPDEGGHIITSPIVGTFYRAPSPDAPSFVDVGSRVKKGQVLCIIEAMKLMNEIESDVDGVVTKIFPQNAQAVEYGEPLFAVNPD
ncbi:MAG TPA: acetyl-CoA carboxylase biotin carboxyl carrier protein [Thermoanaerobaculia bacterium]|nr:acetyl-CoA carboxylase biotin carboxyl carrier protein [Thermoanaerobaculia bacterium]